ncbi:unnamed protein product [Porites lobata]|uniref:DNA-directed DNA polymerase n=1 Tax=Porites lobata TaxID=104759 RepID=A0ABN8S0P7_9CNID|nr:unnamed protein product [Porites lobata]
MDSKKREKFLTWYNQQVSSNAIFNFQEELLKYCESDVALLKEGCLKFVKEFEEIAGFNPLIQSITIAAACNYFWRKEKLEEDLIALEPNGGWHGNHINQSQIALEWLYFQDHQRGGMGRVRHVRNGGEVQVLTPAESYYVDGFDEETNTVFEFYGCFYHGCPRCFKSGRHAKNNCHKDRTIDEVYDATLKKAAMLRQAGYTLVECWECEFNEEKKINPQLKAFLDTLEMVPPLNPREAFYGGRTGAVTLHCKVEEPDLIKYADVTSLYPWVNKYKEYPVRFPLIYTNTRDQDIHHYFGIAQVDILPPELLYHPVLPYRAGNKLTFPLCRACVEQEQQKPWLERTNICPHTDAERMLRGTWATIELQKAVEKGYKILKIHEVWHFQEEDRRVGLFADYVNTWLKIKQESAGWPEECRSREEKQAYIRDYYEKEGIHLEHVAKNPGRKQVAKLMLNSFWGKFGERNNKPQTHVIQSAHQLYCLLNDPLYHISSVRICTEDVMEVVTTRAEEEAEQNLKTNMFIAIYTTAHARLKLYSALETLQERVLYYDTDSVIYKWRPGQGEIPLGVFLGDFTDEVEGDPIIEFASGGAKNYGYETRGGKVECKVRGFSLNYRNKLLLNFYALRDNILKELDDPQEERRNITLVDKNFFDRDQTNKRIRLIEREKKYGLVFDKRVVDRATRKSYPYGYARIGSEVDMLSEL